VISKCVFFERLRCDSSAWRWWLLQLPWQLSRLPHGEGPRTQRLDSVSLGVSLQNRCSHMMSISGSISDVPLVLQGCVGAQPCHETVRWYLLRGNISVMCVCVGVCVCVCVRVRIRVCSKSPSIDPCFVWPIYDIDLLWSRHAVSHRLPQGCLRPAG